MASLTVLVKLMMSFWQMMRFKQKLKHFGLKQSCGLFKVANRENGVSLFRNIFENQNSVSADRVFDK